TTTCRAYQHLNAWSSLQRGPLIIGMDANAWGDWLDPAEAEPAGDDDWSDERRFHGPQPAHGLVDTLRVAEARRAGPHELPLAVTHVIPSRRIRMDRIYTSAGITVVAAGLRYKAGIDPRAAGPRERLSSRRPPHLG